MRHDIIALRDLFYQAHSGTSFFPEVRADRCVEDFSEELDADLKELGENCGRYAEKYIAHLRIWASRKSRCMSPMIVGPARFPVQANRKKMDAEHNAWVEFRKWRERFIRKASAERTLSPEEELDKALEDLDKALAHHDMMIGVNKILREKASEAEKVVRISEEYGLSEEVSAKIVKPDPIDGSGFQSFVLTNHNAKIKRLKDKVLIMKARISRKEAFEKIAFEGGSIDIENDRVVIRHDQKPEKEVIEKLRSYGFRWSPNWHCWCRKHTANALRDARIICEVKE